MFRLFGYGCLTSLGSWLIFTLLGTLINSIIGGNGETESPLLIFVVLILLPSLLAYFLLSHQNQSKRKTEEELILPFGILSTPFMIILIAILSGFDLNSDLSGSSIGISLLSTVLFTFIMSVAVGKANRRKDEEEEAQRERQAQLEAERKQKEEERQIAERNAQLAAQTRKIENVRAKIKEYDCFCLNVIPFLMEIEKTNNSSLDHHAPYKKLIDNIEVDSKKIEVISYNIKEVAESVHIPDRLNIHSR